MLFGKTRRIPRRFYDNLKFEGSRMTDVMLDGFRVGVVGGVVGGFIAVVYMMRNAPRECPKCGAALPRFRMPSNSRQALWGGWSCPQCGCKIDRRGCPE